MSLMTGEIVQLYRNAEDLAFAKVSVGGAYVHVVVEFLPDAQPGDVILIESGVAIGRIETKQTKEALLCALQSQEKS